MEQYGLFIPVYYENIRKALENFTPKRIFIRWVGTDGDKTVVRENLKGKTLDIKKTDKGLSIIINGTEQFFYKIDSDWDREFFIAYFRGHKIALPTGINPDDPTLPPVEESILEAANYTHLMKITFEGKIPLRVLSPKSRKRPWDFWGIDV